MAEPSKAVTQNGQSKKRKKTHLFRYGNYRHYYGYRVGREMEEDPRLKFLRREWFEGKDCLDVGCNEGLVTIAVAQKYNCNSMLGVDLDRGLITKAKDNLEAAIAASDKHTDVRKSAEIETVTQSDGGGERLHGTPSIDNGGTDAVLRHETVLQRVTFKQEQFIDDFPHGDHSKDGNFDTILCLSVTKWVHLNWGDEGLINLFAKIYHILRMGGVLILEPQPWKSYVSKNYVSEITKINFGKIVLRPDHFKAILLNKIGFKSVSEISKAVPNSTKGFNRALYVYTK